MRLKDILFSLPLMALPLLAACTASNGNGHHSGSCDTIPMQYAKHLTMVDYGDYIKADFRNPWDTTKLLQSYLLVPASTPVPENLPKGVVLRTPLSNSLVYSSVHCSLIDELGSIDDIAGVCDARYITNPQTRARLDSGSIVDCGQSMAPNIEKILMLNPDAILLSAYENSNDHNKVDQMGIPIVDCIDYMETSPLGRAEWMRFFGRLYGKGQQADSLFNATVDKYDEIKEMVSAADGKPVVLTEKIYGQTWGVPGALSTVGCLINDAGGKNAFDEYQKSGSVMLAPEEVLYKASNADIWMIKYSQATPLTLRQMKADNAIYSKFKPYESGNIFICNTDSTAYFDDAAFHPQWILAEMANIFHPELNIQPQRAYYKKIEP